MPLGALLHLPGLAGLAVGASLGALAGWIGAGRPGVAGRLRAPLTAAARASGALLGFVVLLNLDVLLARHHLPAAATGEYAVASIVTKVAFWLPQGVGVLLLPKLAEAAGRHRALPSALGAVAALGTLLALAQLLLFSGIASADRLATAAVWSAAALEAVVVEALAATGRLSPASLAGTAALVAIALVTTGLLRLRRVRSIAVPVAGGTVAVPRT